jgi:hypothetical protein
MIEKSAVYHMTSLQKVQDNSKSLLTYWETEWQQLGNDLHLIGMVDKLIVTNDLKTKHPAMVWYLFRYLQNVYSSK